MSKNIDFWGRMLYHSDIIYALIFLLFVFTLLYQVGSLSPNTFKILGDSSKWTSEKVWFFVWLVPFLLYLYYPAYSLWRKSREEWYSRLFASRGATFTAILAAFYMLIYWSGHINNLFNLDYFGILFIVFYYFTGF